MAFRDPIVAGLNLIREAIRSPNYVPNVSGWTVNKDGSSEFGNTVIRGSLRAGTAVDYITVDSTGIKLFSGNILVAHWDLIPGGVANNPIWVYNLRVESLLQFVSAIDNPANVRAGIFHNGRGLTFQIENFLAAPDPGEMKFEDEGTGNPLTLLNGPNDRVVDSRHIYVLDFPSSGTLTKTGADQAFATIPGCFATFTTVNPNARVQVSATMDYEQTVAGSVLGVGQIVVDGVADPGMILAPNALATRGSYSRSWAKTLAAGIHTIDFQARKTGGAGTALFRNPHSTLQLTIFDCFT